MYILPTVHVYAVPLCSSLKTVMEKEGLMTGEDPSTDVVSEEERHDQLAMWKSLPKVCIRAYGCMYVLCMHHLCVLVNYTLVCI